MNKQAENQNPLHQLLKERWSPRAFSDRPVSADDLRSLMEAARWAPSSSNGQPWFFIVAQKQNAAEFEKALSCLNPRNATWATSAPALIFAVARTEFENPDKPSKLNRHHAYDLGQSVALLTVEATSLGLHVHQMAGISPEKVKEAYGVPEGYEIFTGVAIGYLGDPEKLPEDLREREKAPRKRKPLNSFVFEGKWGQAAPFISK
jgi:nitroreductase